MFLLLLLKPNSLPCQPPPQVLATSMRRNADAINGLENDPVGTEGGQSLNSGEDDDNMVSGSIGSTQFISRDKHLRYRTRVFAAEYVMLYSMHCLK